MNLKEGYEYYDDYTSRASDNARNLCYAGIGLIWIYKTDGNIVPQALHMPAAIFFVYLGLDLLQYLIGSGFWLWFNRKKKEELLKQINGKDVPDENEEYDNPYEVFYTFANCVFMLKFILLAWAFYLLLSYLLNLNLPSDGG